MACTDAPRDNPLDPLSTLAAPPATVHGTVVVASQGTPIGGARITCLQTGLSTSTDGTGEYRFGPIAAGAWTLICARDMFDPETAEVTLAKGSTTDVSFSLNGAPVVSLERILTHKVDQYFPSAQYYVDVEAAVGDPNGMTDIDSAWFVVDTLVRAMDYSPTSKLWSTRLFKYELPTNTVQWLVGLPLTIKTRDIHGSTGWSVPFYVTRVIETGATPVSPGPGAVDTTGQRPSFSWTGPSVTFFYTYTIVVARVIAGTETVVWTASGIDAVAASFDYPGDGSGSTLPPGNYVWTVSVVDEFGNTCRSKESAFTVQ